MAQKGPPVPLSDLRADHIDASLLDGFGGKNTEGVIGSQFIWSRFILFNMGSFADGAFSFSLRNELNQSVRNIYGILVFFDRDDKPIEMFVVQYDDLIPAGLARRITGKVDSSVQQLTTEDGSVTPSSRIDFRVLDFELVP